MKDTLFSSQFRLNAKGILHEFSKPIVMGILNATPDSFYAASKIKETALGIKKAKQMIAEGAGILDIGGYSSRPGATEVSESEEIERVTALIEGIRTEFPSVLISIDTFRANVANAAILAGANIVNDISGGTIDPEILDVAAMYKCPYIMMHLRGTPQTMMQNTEYDNLIKEVVYFFSNQIEKAKKAGITDIIIDPGFGFSKTVSQNYELLGKLDVLKLLDKPILAGFSRKSMIYKSLQITANESLNGTTVLNTIALNKGASILRVHDVKEACEAVKLSGLVWGNL